MKQREQLHVYNCFYFIKSLQIEEVMLSLFPTLHGNYIFFKMYLYLVPKIANIANLKSIEFEMLKILYKSDVSHHRKT